MYAIAELIQQELTNRNWRKSQLVAAMGYKNLTRGLKRLEHCLHTGDCANAVLLSRLRHALELPTEQFNAAIAATQQQRAREEQARAAHEEAEQRARFRPYIYVRTSASRPSSITAAALIGPRLKHLRLDEEATALPRPFLLSLVTSLVREHYRSNQGNCPLFGNITGYALRISYDATVEFSIDGTLIQEHEGWNEDEGCATLTVGKQVVREGLF